jgi:hypothetical protein
MPRLIWKTELEKPNDALLRYVKLVYPEGSKSQQKRVAAIARHWNKRGVPMKDVKDVLKFDPLSIVSAFVKCKECKRWTIRDNVDNTDVCSLHWTE